MSVKSGPAKSSKGAHLVSDLRRRIMDGHLPPGSRMPTRIELENEFQASPVTVQRAFDALVKDEFVEVRGNRTYVAEHPPHSSRYGLVFMSNPMAAAEQRGFLAKLYREALALDDSGKQRLPIYCDTNPHQEGGSLRQLSLDVQAHRLAGLLFSTPAGFYNQTPVLQVPGIPRVAIALHQEDPTIPVVGFNWSSFRKRSLEYLRKQGRTRLALMYYSHVDFREWRKAILEHGFEVHPHWMLPMSIKEPVTARHCAQLLMHAGQKDRPDALIVADDHFTESAVEGLLASGVRVPEELDVVVQCNYPAAAHPSLPIVNLGLDVRSLLRLCIDSIERQRAGKSVPSETLLPALFAEELV